MKQLCLSWILTLLELCGEETQQASAIAFNSSSSSDERQPSQPTSGWLQRAITAPFTLCLITKTRIKFVNLIKVSKIIWKSRFYTFLINERIFKIRRKFLKMFNVTKYIILKVRRICLENSVLEECDSFWGVREVKQESTILRIKIDTRKSFQN